MPEPDKKDAIQDTIVRGLSMRQRSDIRRTTNQIVMMLELNDVDPMVAYTSLLNALGSLIGTRLISERETLTARAQQMLPLYVEVYRVKEKQI